MRVVGLGNAFASTARYMHEQYEKDDGDGPAMTHLALMKAQGMCRCFGGCWPLGNASGCSYLHRAANGPAVVTVTVSRVTVSRTKGPPANTGESASC